MEGLISFDIDKNASDVSADKRIQSHSEVPIKEPAGENDSRIAGKDNTPCLLIKNDALYHLMKS